MSHNATLEARKDTASRWFQTLQERLLAAMEALERKCHRPVLRRGAREQGRFELKPWRRTDHSGAPGSGGRMAILKGRLFEKMGAESMPPPCSGRFRLNSPSRIPPTP